MAHEVIGRGKCAGCGEAVAVKRAANGFGHWGCQFCGCRFSTYSKQSHDAMLKTQGLTDAKDKPDAGKPEPKAAPRARSLGAAILGRDDD